MCVGVVLTFSFIKCKDYFQGRDHQNWNHLIQDSSRCLHFKEFKSLLHTERYLKMNLPVKYRQAHSRFRCGSHKLNVELDRPCEQRVC